MDSKQEVLSGPPAPRLLPGSLLAHCYEIDILLCSDNHKNIYLARDERDDMIHVVELHGDLPEPIAVPETCSAYVVEPFEVLRANDRVYMLCARWTGRQYVEIELPSSDDELCAWMSRFAQALLALEAAGIGLEHVSLSDIYLDENRLFLLVYPLAASENSMVPDLVYGFVKELLFRRVRPKLTRNLARPLGCLGLSAQLEDTLAKFLERDMGVVPLIAYLEKRQSARLAYWDISAQTNDGLVRAHNEDAYAWLTLERETYRLDQALNLLLVSDGMGGHQQGEVASHYAISGCLGHMVQSLFALSSACKENPEMLALVGEAFDHAQKVLQEEPELVNTTGFALSDKPGATLVAGILHKRLLFVGHCGDSRAYLFDETGFQRLTRDHSLVQLYVDQGQLSEEESFGHSHSNVITSFMGIDQKSFRRDVSAWYVGQGARLLLCSDGLTDMIREHEIESILTGSANAREACERLIDASNGAGGNDNITVLVAFDRQLETTTASEEPSASQTERGETPTEPATDEMGIEHEEENNL